MSLDNKKDNKLYNKPLTIFTMQSKTGAVKAPVSLFCDTLSVDCNLV